MLTRSPALRYRRSSVSCSLPTSTALSVRSSSQSITRAAKERVLARYSATTPSGSA